MNLYLFSKGGSEVVSAVVLWVVTPCSLAHGHSSVQDKFVSICKTKMNTARKPALYGNWWLEALCCAVGVEWIELAAWSNDSTGC